MTGAWGLRQAPVHKNYHFAKRRIRNDAVIFLKTCFTKRLVHSIQVILALLQHQALYRRLVRYEYDVIDQFLVTFADLLGLSALMKQLWIENLCTKHKKTNSAKYYRLNGEWNAANRILYELALKFAAGDNPVRTMVQSITTAFPVFFPCSIPMKASGIFSNPLVIVSRVFNRPCTNSSCFNFSVDNIYLAFPALALISVVSRGRHRRTYAFVQRVTR